VTEHRRRRGAIFIDVIGLALDIVLMLRSQAAVTAGCPICGVAGPMEGFIPDQAFGEDGGNNERFTSANKLIADELMYCPTISQDYVPRNYIPDGLSIRLSI